jgi:hypothetical protein
MSAARRTSTASDWDAEIAALPDDVFGGLLGPRIDDVARRVGAVSLNGGADDDDNAHLPAPICLADLPPSEPLSFRVDRVLIKDDVNAIVGDGDAGKSTLLLALFGAMAAGVPALGDLAATPGPVLYVSGEDSGAVIRNRLEAIAAGHHWNRDLMLSRFHVLDDGADLDDLRWQLHLLEAARDLKAVAAAFDPLGDLCGDGVKEDSNTDAKRVTRYLRRFMRLSGATPVLVMHVSKPAEGKERKHRVRGASAWRNATRLCWWVEAMDGGMELDPIKANRLASRTPLRLKRTVSTDPGHPLMWRAAHIALDSEGDVVGQDVMRLLRWLATCSSRLSGREVAHGDHGLPRDRAEAALITAGGKRWADHVDGPRRAHLWGVTDAGRARLLLESAPVSESVR